MCYNLSVEDNTEKVEQNVTTNVPDTEYFVDEKGQIIKPDSPPQVTDGKENEMQSEVQDLADERGGLNPEDFSGEMRAIVEENVKGSEIAAEARKKLREKMGKVEIPIDKNKIRSGE